MESKIKLNEIKTTRKGIETFGKDLITKIEDNIFSFHSKEVLLFNILNQISPINESLKLDAISIENACEKVMTYFGLQDEDTFRIQMKDGWKEFKNLKKNNTEKFCKEIIQLDKVPADVLETLSEQVKQDFNDISNLIKWYEDEKGKPFNTKHEEKRWDDFYNRCVAEKDEIMQFKSDEIKKRAISKSKYIPNGYESTEFQEMLNDRPYYFARPFSKPYFDYREIDLVGHRINELNLDEIIQMKKIYSENPKEFYRAYFQLIPVQQHFLDFKKYLPVLPLKNNRDAIFEELIKLFKAEMWIGFYALALPQIEGLFTEMCEAISIPKQSSLPNKVDKIRPFHHASHIDFNYSFFHGKNYFDYYQYHIPLQRNRFAHTGFDKNFEYKSYDLLADLSHLLKVFYILNEPLLKIKKLHKRKKIEDFISLKDFLDYFQLLTKLEDQQKYIEMKPFIDEFEKNFLSQCCNIENTCDKIIKELPSKLEEFIETINKSFNHQNGTSHFDLKKVSVKKIKYLLEDKTYSDTIEGYFRIRYNIVEELVKFFEFSHCLNRHFPNLKKEVKVEIENLRDKYKSELKKIWYIDKTVGTKSFSNMYEGYWFSIRTQL